MHLFIFLLSGCDVLTSSVGTVKPPKAELSHVDLTHGPTLDQTLAWSCYEFLNSDVTCQLAGYDSQPSNATMELSFDLVFDLQNQNTTLPIPLVEVLLGINVMDDTNLGAVCISFCDPDMAECVPTTNAEDGCTIDEDETTDITEPEDLIPTVDDLVTLAQDIASGDIDNGDFRMIPAGESVEGHIQFDLNVDTTFNLAKSLLKDAVNDFLAGRDVRIEVPYTVDGSIFFDVPDLGRYAVNFGPFSDVWPIK
jgi:hypothetical protein